MAELEPTQVDEFVQEAAALAARDWAEIEQFLETFSAIQQRAAPEGHPNKRDVSAEVLRALAKEYQKDLIARLAEIGRWAQGGGKGQHRCWAFYQAFCKVLPELSFEPETLVDALEAADPVGGGIYKAVENLALRSRETAARLFDTFVARPHSPVVLLAGNALSGLAHLDLLEAHHRALVMAQAKAGVLRRIGIGTLSSLNYPETAEDLLRGTLDRFAELSAVPDSETDWMLVQGYGLLTPHSEEARSAFLSMAARDDPAVQSEVAFTLSQRASSDHQQVWYSTALMSLTRVPTQFQGIGDIDHCVASCAHSRPEIATEFLEAFVKSRAYGTQGEDAKLPELLNQTFWVLRQESLKAFEEMITRWFSSTDTRLHHAASDLVMHGHYGSPYMKLSPIKLSKLVLDSLDEQMQVLVLLRVLGYVIGGRLLAALIASALRCEPLTPPIANMIEDALADYVLYNYPGSGEEYLKAYLEEGDISKPARDILQRALARSETYMSALRSLPRLSELRPPAHRLQSLRLAEQKFYGATMGTAPRSSPLLTMLPKFHLKFGASFFTEVEGTFTEPTALGVISHSPERERGEAIDPLGQELLRIQWRAAGPQEEQEEG